MTTYRVEFHADTANDFYEAYSWYQNQSDGLGEKFLTAVRTKIDQIASAPEAYAAKHRKGYRECKVDIFPYLIVFKLYKTKKVIFVSSIHHEKKHLNTKYRK